MLRFCTDGVSNHKVSLTALTHVFSLIKENFAILKNNTILRHIFVVSLKIVSFHFNSTYGVVVTTA
jgi:hypothetical protein